MSLMRRPFRSQIGFLAFLLAVVFVLPAVAHAADGVAAKDKIDPDQTITDGCDKILDIHGAVVRIRFVRKKVFMAVKSGTLDCKDMSGKLLFTIPAGTVVIVGPVDGTPKIGGVSVQNTLLTSIFANNLIWIGGNPDNAWRSDPDVWTFAPLNAVLWARPFISGPLGGGLGGLSLSQQEIYRNALRVGPYLTIS